MKVNNLRRYINFRVREKRALIMQMKNYLETNNDCLISGSYSIAKCESGKIIAYNYNKRYKFFVEKIVNHRYVFSEWQTWLKSNVRKSVDHIIDLPNFKVKSLKPSFNGQLIMLTYNNDVKIFDLISKKVIHIVNDKNSYLKLIEITNTFKFYFDIPILTFLKNKQGYLEKFIDFKPHCDWTLWEKENAVDIIFSNYEKYFNFCSSNSHFILRNISQELETLKYLSDRSGLINKIDSVIQMSPNNDWIYVNCHGDMVFSNILLHEKKYYFIDWIDSGRYIFFYDLFNFMFGEATFHHNYFYIKNYIDGVYDEYLTRIFGLFNLEYDRKQKMYYIALFLINRIKFRIENKNDKNLDVVLSSYHSTFISIENLMKNKNYLQ